MDGEDDGKIVCLKCLRENPGSNAFCADCNAPIGMISTIDPIQRNVAVGWVFRSAASGPPKRIILLGVWLLFAPVAVGAAWLVVAGRVHGVVTILISTLVALYALTVLYRTTQNYLLKRAQVSG